MRICSILAKIWEGIINSELMTKKGYHKYFGKSWQNFPRVKYSEKRGSSEIVGGCIIGLGREGRRWRTGQGGRWGPGG